MLEEEQVREEKKLQKKRNREHRKEVIEKVKEEIGSAEVLKVCPRPRGQCLFRAPAQWTTEPVFRVVCSPFVPFCESHASQ